MTLIKICGITNLEDALVSIEAGAHALGFNFYHASPRYIDPVAARQIIEQIPANVLTVGVFVNEEHPSQVEKIANEAGVAALQLHGDESPDYCEALLDRFVIKALSVRSNFQPERAREYKVQAIMLDAFNENARGGTGQTIDWSMAREIRELVPRLFLAGGLSPENIAEAISVVQPYAVDACSRLEVRPGKKDHERLRAFTKAVRAAFRP
jgi:phosphoribosylanthranilate isomerase